MVDTEVNERVLVVCAHPDDVDVNAGGTLGAWVDEGAVVTVLVVTSGDAGGYGSVSREEIVATRRSEQRSAAAELGITDVRFLEGYLDGAVTVTPALVRDISRVVRQVRPRRMMTMSPERDWTNIAQGHPDHLAVGEAAVRAFYPYARNPFAFPELIADEGLQDWIVDELWLQAPPNPTTVVDITDQLERKLRAVLAHTSQFEDPKDVARFFRERMVELGARHGLEPGRAAETFTVVSGRG